MDRLKGLAVAVYDNPREKKGADKWLSATWWGGLYREVLIQKMISKLSVTKLGNGQPFIEMAGHYCLTS